MYRVWLKALAVKLVASPEIELANISCKNGISELSECDYNKIKQWAFPCFKVDKKGCPDKSTEERFSRVIDTFKPNIIQIWGSENLFRLLPFDDKYPGIKVLTMQGVLSSIAPVVHGGMSFTDKLRTIGLREILTRRNIFSIRKSFVTDGIIEYGIIRKSDFIITQSDWTDSQIRHINSGAKLYRTHRALREEFINCTKWNDFAHNSPILYSAAVGYSFKGLHVLIKAIEIVKTQFPTVELRLAGATGRKDLLGEGYLRFILRLIRNLDLEKNVRWLGAIPASEIVKNLQEASVFINPSFVESYSLVLAEAMSVGTPSVVSFAGAMPELAENNKEAIYFSPMDYKQCAHLIIKLLSDKNLSMGISKNAISRSEERNVRFDIVQEQLEIYNDIIKQTKSVGQCKFIP